jgi:hypothetical protein
MMEKFPGHASAGAPRGSEVLFPRETLNIYISIPIYIYIIIIKNVRVPWFGSSNAF